MKDAQSKSCGNPVSFGKECTSRIKCAENCDETGIFGSLLLALVAFQCSCCCHRCRMRASHAATELDATPDCLQFAVASSSTLCHLVGQSLVFITVDKFPPFVQKISSTIFQQIRPPNVQIFSRASLHIIIDSSCIHSREAMGNGVGFDFRG